MVTTLLIWLFYVAGFIAMFSIMTILAYWLRWVILCCYALVPAMVIVWAGWLVIALPINIMFDGWAFEQKVVKISHWLNDATWNVLCFAFLAPFKAIGLIIDILYWIVN